MIRQLSRALSGFTLSVLVIYLMLHTFVWHHADIFNFQARVEALLLGISVALLATLVGSIVRLKLKRTLETTRIEERAIRFILFESEVDEYIIGDVSATAYTQRSDVSKREYVHVEVLPALEPLEEVV